MDRAAVLSKVEELRLRLAQPGADRGAVALEAWEALRGVPERVRLDDAELAVPMIALVRDLVELGSHTAPGAVYVLAEVRDLIVRYCPSGRRWVVPAGTVIPRGLRGSREAEVFDELTYDRGSGTAWTSGAGWTHREVPEPGRRARVLGRGEGTVVGVEMPNVLVLLDGEEEPVRVWWGNAAVDPEDAL